MAATPNSRNQLCNGAVHYEKNKDSKQSNTEGKLPRWILLWFYTTAAICTWDASFIVLRPMSLPGGSLSTLFYVYKFYITVDQRYVDESDAFVFAQSLLNYVEVIINVITIIMHYRSSRHTIVTAFTVTVMTFWKTVLYFLMFTDLCTGSQYRTGNTAWEEFFLVVIPNGVWVVIPGLAILQLWGRLAEAAAQEKLTHMNGTTSVMSRDEFTSDQLKTSKREVVRGPGSLVLNSGKSDTEDSPDSSVAASVKRRAKAKA